MTINKTIDGDKMTIGVEGRLDTVSAPELEKEIKENATGIKELVVDFSGLEYISSAGLRVLLGAHKLMLTQGNMVVENVSDEVGEVFEITGFSDILNIK